MENTLDSYKNKMTINRENIIKCNGNICYIYNKNLKKHLFISKEVLEYVKKAAEQEIEVTAFIDKFEDKDDKNYISNVIQKMITVGYLKINNNNEKSKYKKINSVYFMLTQRCNLNCIHCSTCCNPTEKDTLSIDDIITILKNISKLKPSSIVFTGGEPLLISDLKQILTISRKLMPSTKFILSTNGTLINKQNINLMSYFDKIDISIDGVDEDTCSKIRGNGVFNKVISNIKLLQSNGYNNIHLSMVFGEKTNHLKKDFEKLNNKINTNPIYRSFEPIGRGYDNYLFFNNDRHHLPVNTTEIYKTKNYSRHISSCSCNAFESTLYIDCNGIAYPCASLLNKTYKLMDFKKIIFSNKELYNILNSKKRAFKKILEYKGTKCENCDLNIFCWNCPAIFENAKKNNEIDIWCNRIKENLQKKIWRQV